MSGLHCARCGRALKHPGGAYAGRLYGRDCMKAMGIVTVKVRPAAIVNRVSRRKNADQLDLFNAEAAPALALQTQGTA